MPVAPTPASGSALTYIRGTPKRLPDKYLWIRPQRPVRRRPDLLDAWHPHPGLQPPEVAARVGVVGDEDVEHFQQVGHRTGVGHDDVHGRNQRPAPTRGDDAARRRVGAERVVRRRAATRGPGLFADSEGAERRRRRRTRAVRRARSERRGEIVCAVGTFGPAVQPALHAAVGHGRHVRQADQDRSRGPQAFDDERVALGHQLRECRAARGHGQTADLVAVLGRVGDAVQWTVGVPGRPPGVGGLGFGAGVGVGHDDGVELAVEGRDAGEMALEQPDGGRAAGLHGGAQLGDRRLVNVEVVAHRDVYRGRTTISCTWASGGVLTACATTAATV